MDYDPDDINCYPDDDLPYEGLIQSNCTLDQAHGNHGATTGHRGHRGSGSNGSTSSSSSPALFDSNSGIDMPLLSNTQHYHHQTAISSSKLQQQQQRQHPPKQPKNYEVTAGANSSAYATVLPSANMQTTPRQQSSYFQQKVATRSSQHGLIVDSQQQNYMNHVASANYMARHQIQQNSPSLNHSHEYGKRMQFICL